VHAKANRPETGPLLIWRRPEQFDTDAKPWDESKDHATKQ